MVTRGLACSKSLMISCVFCLRRVAPHQVNRIVPLSGWSAAMPADGRTAAARLLAIQAAASIRAAPRTLTLAGMVLLPVRFVSDHRPMEAEETRTDLVQIVGGITS